MQRFNDTDNMRANESTPPSQIPSGRGSAGYECMGTENLRAQFDAPPISVPSKTAGTDSTAAGLQRFKDGVV